ncbi:MULTISPECIES: hypothetical protein [unclassified Nostoc]|nr:MULTISPECIES: hypothetical protein [unclassified Nostoc]MBE9002541.1 hypothetical protein [Nostoc sp. LEGE 12447]NEU83191.1 hypothetical protein [Nostoc sp. UIC 10630]
MPTYFVKLSQLKILNSEGADWIQENQHSLCDRILYGCKETLFNQLI